ncbi:MAG: hypothetical protein LBQ81_09810 [Zoogloeaceae bacterium]|nr:hypothetical protein [Zoogloeaceae bacterium]
MAKIIIWLTRIVAAAFIATPLLLLATGRIAEFILLAIVVFLLWSVWTLVRFLTWRP